MERVDMYFTASLKARLRRIRRLPNQLGNCTVLRFGDQRRHGQGAPSIVGAVLCGGAQSEEELRAARAALINLELVHWVLCTFLL